LQEFQDCFEKWKTRLDRCIEGIQFVTPKNIYKIFYYKIPVSFGYPFVYIYIYIFI
jgi:hypothetical protein